MSFYALRYVAGTDLRDRKHTAVDAQYDDFAGADDARLSMPRPELLEVVVRGGQNPGEHQ